MSANRETPNGSLDSSPRGPWDAPPRAPAGPPATPPPIAIKRRWPIWSTLFFVLVTAGVGIRAYRDLSRPEAWAYWRETYFSPSMTSSVVKKATLDDADGGRAALVISGKIGAASASWLRERLDQAHLVPGDIVLLSSPGGNVDQALLMGEIIRARGLATAVGTLNGSGRVMRSYCASACVFVYAGGTRRYGVEGSVLGVHRFTKSRPDEDAYADAQRLAGSILGYMTRMGVSSTVVEAMSATSDIRWLSPAEALTMNLVTHPLGPSSAARR